MIDLRSLLALIRELWRALGVATFPYLEGDDDGPGH